jgi:hypothetical protein
MTLRFCGLLIVIEPMFFAGEQVIELCDQLDELFVILLHLDALAQPVHLLTFFRAHMRIGSVTFA